MLLRYYVKVMPSGAFFSNRTYPILTGKSHENHKLS